MASTAVNSPKRLVSPRATMSGDAAAPAAAFAAAEVAVASTSSDASNRVGLGLPADEAIGALAGTQLTRR